MKRYGWKLTVLIVLAALVFVWLVRAPILASYLRDKIGLKVSLEWVGIWPSRTNIHNFAVKNPKSFQGNAFKARRVDCSYHFGSLFADPTVIDQIEIKDSVLTIDFPSKLSTSNNWTAIGQNSKSSQKNNHVIIRKLILTNFNVEIQGSNLFAKPKQTHFDYLEFDDIDSEEGFPTARLVKLIFQSGGIDQYIQGLFNPGSTIQKALSPLKVFGD